MDKMKIEFKLEDIIKFLEYRKRLNETKLSDISFTFEDKEIEVSKYEIDEWNFVGLGNLSFVEFHLLNDHRGFGDPIENKTNG